MIVHGDCKDVLPTMEPDSFDAVVTDPPYHLTTNKRGGSGLASLNTNSPAGRSRVGTGFMGKAWDGGDIAHSPEVWVEVLRVSKPGAHLLAFGGTRTFHRLACAIEDAGWELRDTIMWVYGSGFPKSHNGPWGGTALKPAWEPIIVARKALDGTVAENHAKHGTGALNIDGCRVAHTTVPGGSLAVNSHLRTAISGGNGGRIIASEPERRSTIPVEDGRWPANLIHDGSEEVTSRFPMQSGGGQPTRRFSDKTRNAFGKFKGDVCPPGVGPSSGNASRFFYCAKASQEDRGPNNTHPTVKPTSLMRYLCRLVTPERGRILDPFAGSGSTGKAAVMEGFSFVGIEQEAEYVSIARARIEEATPLGFAM